MKSVPDQHFENFLKTNITSSFSFSHVTGREISDIIGNMKNKNSQGHDNISNRLMKKISPAIVYPLSVIVNQSLYLGKFPDSLKIAKVIPIYKKSEFDKFENYRPISILPSLSKIFEKVVHKQILKYFTDNDLFMQSQHGFRPNFSTETVAIEFVDRIKIKIDNGHVPLSIFMDLSKAFDTINHEILLTKLKFYGLDFSSLSWFTSYISNRKQYVSYEDEDSSMEYLSIGVPQGSILGPLLFLIYVNNIQFISDKFILICFADDTHSFYHFVFI